MATMDGYVVAVNDTVHDILYGPGRVTEILPAGSSFRVQFSTRGAATVFSNGGFASRFPNRTLYWRDPVVVVPFKDDAGWNKIRPIVAAVISAFRQVAS